MNCYRCRGYGVVNGALCPRCHGQGKERERHVEAQRVRGGRIVGDWFINNPGYRHVFGGDL